MKKVTVGIILFGDKYLKKSIPSILNQDYENIEYIFIDQEEGKHSAYKFLKKEMPEIFDKVKLIKGGNLWHSGGHNKIINMMTGDYYLCASNDMLYPSNLLSTLIKEIQKNPDYSVTSCKLKRWDYLNNKKTNYIDSLGIAKTDYHHFYDMGQGELDNGQYKNLKEIWGISGALFLAKKEALEAIKDNGEYFDSRIHYKNDVDLSFRLKRAGQKCLLVQKLEAYHDRQVADKTKKTLWVKKSSFIGERILMQKNYWPFTKKYPLKVRIKTRIYHFLKTTYLLLTTPTLIKDFWQSHR